MNCKYGAEVEYKKIYDALKITIPFDFFVTLLNEIIEKDHFTFKDCEIEFLNYLGNNSSNFVLLQKCK